MNNSMGGAAVPLRPQCFVKQPTLTSCFVATSARMPKTFNRWISANPAIYWSDAAFPAMENEFLKRYHQPLDIELHLSARQYEGETLRLSIRARLKSKRGWSTPSKRVSRILAHEMARRWSKLTCPQKR